MSFTVTAADNCPGVSFSCTPPSGSFFDVGVTPVTCIATDATGNANYFAADFSADGKSLYIVSNANDDGIARRAKLDLATKKIEFLE